MEKLIKCIAQVGSLLILSHKLPSNLEGSQVLCSLIFSYFHRLSIGYWSDHIQRVHHWLLLTRGFPQDFTGLSKSSAANLKQVLISFFSVQLCAVSYRVQNQCEVLESCWMFLFLSAPWPLDSSLL
ncbi:hypothetical protein ILYODFUR_013493 [Ilyodon furcidens]|uniref:Uncharacterized protein n=1 Tax=Ilyodon furcidens TaxID=33524 RepID=A0ABV0TVE9_9TELE